MNNKLFSFVKLDLANGSGHGSKWVQVKTGSGQNGSLKKRFFGLGQNGFASKQVRVRTGSGQNGFGSERVSGRVS
ncbi:hypothetical protein Hanom_Chr01g00066901 [Helianthus anomalus]